MKGTVTAVHEDDLVEYLDKLRIRRELEQGEMLCFGCKEALSLKNLAVIFPDSGAVKGVCDKPECISALMRWREEKRNG